MTKPNKSLGQHWLHDPEILDTIVEYADVTSDDMVVEIGPGLGTLTSHILHRTERMVAVEYDAELAKNLIQSFPGTGLRVVHEDFLHYDLTQLPPDYKVIANIPYYITAKIIQHLTDTNNAPQCAVILMQKEVAERIAADAGQMSVLAIATQIIFTVELGMIVPAEFFTPPPKVDSQVLILKRRSHPLVDQAERRDLLRVVKAGFSERRKKLRSSLAGGLHLSKHVVDEVLEASGVAVTARAQELSIAQWQTITRTIKNIKIS